MQKCSYADEYSLAAASVTTEASSVASSLKDLQKWSLPTVRAEDIEICRRPDGSPFQLGRGGFCRVGLATCCACGSSQLKGPTSEAAHFNQLPRASLTDAIHSKPAA